MGDLIIVRVKCGLVEDPFLEVMVTLSIGHEVSHGSTYVVDALR